MPLTMTLTEVSNQLVGQKRHRTFRVSTAGTYSTGGHAFSARQLGLETLDYLMVGGAFYNGTNGLGAAWDHPNRKLVFFYGDGASANPLAQPANGTTLTNYVGFVTAIGTP